MANEVIDTQVSDDDDALGEFGAEGKAETRPVGAVSVGQSRPASKAAADPIGAVSHVRPEGGADSIGAISLEHFVLDTTPLRFVDGVALVEALCTSIKARGGLNAGMPDLNGAFLTPSGEVVTISQPGGQPAAQELARLLHRLVPTEATPPVGRLFIDRWTSGDSTDLTQFASELAYFARPNGRELLAAIHARAGASASPLPSTALPSGAARSESELAASVNAQARKEPAPKAENPWKLWLRAHRRQLAAAAVAVTTTVAATAMTVWFWPSRTAEAAQRPAQAVEAVEKAEAVKKAGARKTAAGSALPGQRTNRDAGAQSPALVTREPDSQLAAAAPPSTLVVTGASTFADTPAPAADLPGSRLPEMRVYSAIDSGVEPPKLRSAEIPELLIAGFEVRTNFVEVIISARGDVERVRMQGPPQRIPDIVLLSRVKEWAFDPAIKDGIPVRYRLTLSLNVTP